MRSLLLGLAIALLLVPLLPFLLQLLVGTLLSCFLAILLPSGFCVVVALGQRDSEKAEAREAHEVRLSFVVVVVDGVLDQPPICKQINVFVQVNTVTFFMLLTGVDFLPVDDAQDDQRHEQDPSGNASSHSTRVDPWRVVPVRGLCGHANWPVVVLGGGALGPVVHGGSGDDRRWESVVRPRGLPARSVVVSVFSADIWAASGAGLEAPTLTFFLEDVLAIWRGRPLLPDGGSHLKEKQN